MSYSPEKPKTITVQQIQAIQINPGEILAVQIPKETSQVEAKEMMEIIKEIFPENRVMIYMANLKLGKIVFKDNKPEVEYESNG